jgi:RNA polymerase-binding transcription factor DksA
MTWKDILKISRLELEIAREYAPEELAKRGGRNVKRPPSRRREGGRKMSGFSQTDADRAKKERDKLMNSPEAQEARMRQQWKKEQEEYENSPEYKKEQEEKQKEQQRVEEHGLVYCKDCGTEFITDSNFNDKCEETPSVISKRPVLCGAEGKDMFSLIQEGKGTKGYGR